MAAENKRVKMDQDNSCDSDNLAGNDVNVDHSGKSSNDSDVIQNVFEPFKMPGLRKISPNTQDTDHKKSKPTLATDDAQTSDGERHEICDEPTSQNVDELVSDRPNDSTKTEGVTLSPAEQLKLTQSAIPYKEPSWSGVPQDKYSFDVLKNGSIISSVALERPYYVFGRLPSCDVTMDHPSLSRYHAVVQYCTSPEDGTDPGWYLYDLDSTHGTWINKHKTYPNKYYRIRVGHVVKFGGSSRLHILQGPVEDTEEESDLTPKEMKEQRERQKMETEIIHQAEIAAEEKKMEEMRRIEEARGCSWGIGDDAMEEEEEEKGESAMATLNILTPESEDLYMNDPKKALKGYYEREGCEEPEYEVVDVGRGKYKCTVELPVDTPTGEPMVAEAVVSGKKKDAVMQCALEACRILDRQGLLRASKHESRKKKKKNWADDDFYDSDDDTYLDRTGDIEKKRRQRMDKAGKSGEEAQNYNMLMEKHKDILKEIEELEGELEKAKADAAAMNDGEMDALDAYMSAIKSGMMDTKTKMKIKRRLMELRQEEQKVRKLVNIAKPAMLPELIKRQDLSSIKKTDVKVLPSVGKIRSLTKQKVMKKSAAPVNVPLSFDDKSMEVEEVEEVEEEEEEEEISVSKDDVKPTDSDSKSDISVLRTTTVSKSETRVKELVVKGPERPPTNTLLNKDLPDKVADVRVPSVEGASSTSDVEKTKDNVSEVSPGANEMDSSSDQQTGNRPLKTQNTERKSKKRKVDRKPAESTYDTSDPDYAVWMPPTNQSGDGKTHLNKKFGY